MFTLIYSLFGREIRKDFTKRIDAIQYAKANGIAYYLVIDAKKVNW